MRYVTSGESHGRLLTAVVTGVPAGIPFDAALVDADLARRQAGYGRGARMAIERDRVEVLSGIRFGLTIGSPVTLTVANRDWENWRDVMSPLPVPADVKRVTAPRPGHADLAGAQKTATRDCRDILERASARETAARVAAGGVAKALLAHVGVSVASYVESIGAESLSVPVDPKTIDLAKVEESPVRCPDSDASAAMCAAIDAARDAGDTLGGTFTVIARGLVPGLGTYAEARGRLDARVAAALMSIPAVKGVEIGDGFAVASRPGSLAHDEIAYRGDTGYFRLTNRAGGIEGGMSTGEPVVVRVAVKPIPTLMSPLRSVDIDTKEPVAASRERSDVCAVPAAAVVGEAELALVCAAAITEMFGATCLADIRTAIEAYRARIVR